MGLLGQRKCLWMRKIRGKAKSELEKGFKSSVVCKRKYLDPETQSKSHHLEKYLILLILK
jgi:hypothetical protein